MIEGHFIYTYMAILEVHTNRTQQDDTLGTYIHRHEYFARLRAFLRRHAPHCTCYRSTRLLSEAYLQEFTCYLRDTQNVFCATSYRSSQTIYVNNRLEIVLSSSSRPCRLELRRFPPQSSTGPFSLDLPLLHLFRCQFLKPRSELLSFRPLPPHTL